MKLKDEIEARETGGCNPVFVIDAEEWEPRTRTGARRA